MTIVTRQRQDEQSAYLAELLGYSHAPDLLARVAFDPNHEPIASELYAKADCIVLKSFFAPPIENPGIAKGSCFVIEFRGDDSEDYRRASVALGLQSFLTNLKASGTRWRGYALGPETIVLIKEKRKGRRLFSLTLLGEGYDSDMVASDDAVRVREGEVHVRNDKVRVREGAGDTDKWSLLLQAVAGRFATVEVTTAAPYPELLDRGSKGPALLICAGREGVRAFDRIGDVTGAGARVDCAKAWECALYGANAGGPFIREGGTVYIERNEGARS